MIIIINKKAISEKKKRTSMDDSVNIIKIHQPFQYRMSNHANNIDVNRSNALVDHIERTLVHKLHADTYIRFGEEGTKT